MRVPVWPRKLNRKLSLALFVMLFILSATHYGIYQYFAEKKANEGEQRLQWDLASNMARNMRPLLEPVVQHEKVREYFRHMVEINPRLDPYLLDEKGKVVEYIPVFRVPQAIFVDLKPVEEFLTPSPNRSLPIYGDNPKDPYTDHPPFSVERIRIGSQPGYLYIVVQSVARKRIFQTLEDLSLAEGSLRFTIVATLSIAGIGALIFFKISRRFETISSVVDGIAAGDLTLRVPVAKMSDEVDKLGSDINSMADTIQSSVETLKTTDQVRRDLIANISHDIISPLALTHGQLEQILQISDDELRVDGRALAQHAMSNVELVLKLLRELFELAKLESQVTVPKVTPFPISDVVFEEVVPRLQHLAALHEIAISSECPEALPMVLGDIDLIERAVHNLVENAIKYSRPGGKVTTSLTEVPAGVRFSVQDTGIGIPADQIPLIFDRFHRVQPERRRDIPGSGLGLTIVKTALEAHGIGVEVTSNVGVGSTFSFVLPTAPAFLEGKHV